MGKINTAKSKASQLKSRALQRLSKLFSGKSLNRSVVRNFVTNVKYDCAFRNFFLLLQAFNFLQPLDF